MQLPSLHEPQPVKLARAVHANRGVESWYRRQLQKMLTAMNADVSGRVESEWVDTNGYGLDDGEPFIRAAGVMCVTGAADGHRILLLHNMERHCWEFPGGGCEWGEAPFNTANRELGEETGISGALSLFPIDVRTVAGVEFHTYHMVCEFVHPILTHEHDDWGWFDLQYIGTHHQPADKVHPGVRATLDMLKRNSQFSNDERGEGFAAFRAAALKPTKLERMLEKQAAVWINSYNEVARKIASDFAMRNAQATDVGVASSLKAAGVAVKFKLTKGMKLAGQNAVAENVALIKSIPQKYLTDVQTAVWANVSKGGDLATLTGYLQKKYGIAYRRAEFIARDQNNKLKATFENQRRKELGIDEGVWQHSGGGKEPRPTHLALSGKKYKLDDGAYDSEIGHNTWPGVEPNCRCTSRAVIKGFGE